MIKRRGKGERNQCTLHHCKEALHVFLLADKKLKPAAKPKLPPNLDQWVKSIKLMWTDCNKTIFHLLPHIFLSFSPCLSFYLTKSTIYLFSFFHFLRLAAIYIFLYFSLCFSLHVYFIPYLFLSIFCLSFILSVYLSI